MTWLNWQSQCKRKKVSQLFFYVCSLTSLIFSLGRMRFQARQGAGGEAKIGGGRGGGRGGGKVGGGWGGGRGGKFRENHFGSVQGTGNWDTAGYNGTSSYNGGAMNGLGLDNGSLYNQAHVNYGGYTPVMFQPQAVQQQQQTPYQISPMMYYSVPPTALQSQLPPCSSS